MNSRSIHRALAVLALCGATPAAGAAETPLERGRYLMQSIVACGNCHTPQGPNGPVVGMELAGALRFEEPPFSAVATGYERALTAVVDANMTTLIGGVLLFSLGSGPIRGFATSLSLGLVTHLFTATVFTRMQLAFWVRWRRPTELVI